MAARRAEETSGIRARGVKLECRAGKDRHIIGANPPVFSVVKGYVGDIGESVTTDIPFERVSTTTYPNQRGIPIEMWKMSW
ncbi:MAG: hypothetical protein IPP22_11345 [Nitrosomonas sp.]|nr:hypothetical protein [Nitrosomonas sp.]